MTVANIMDYCQRNGVVVYDQYDEKDKRKKFYKMRIPIFTEGIITPTSYRDYLVKRPKDCYTYMNELLENDNFRFNTANWVRTW